MKKEEQEYVLPLRNVFRAPKPKRHRRSITAIKRFVWKHARSKNVSITTDVNERIWKEGRIPRRLEVLLRKEKDGKVIVYLKGSKQIAADKKMREADKKKKEDKRKAKEAAEKKKKTEAEKTAEADDAKKLKDKREKEKAAAAIEAKRG